MIMLALVIALAVSSAYAYLQTCGEESHDPMGSVIEISCTAEGIQFPPAC